MATLVLDEPRVSGHPSAIDRRTSHVLTWLYSHAIAVLCTLGVLDAVLFFFMRPDVNDLWAARARASAVQNGVGLTYWFSWFAGGSTPGSYSVVTPWLSAIIGTELVLALSAGILPILIARLVRGTEHPIAATLVGLVVVAANLWSGRVPFLFSAVFGVAALLAFRQHKMVLTAAAMLVSVVASPTVAAFIALGMAGVFLSVPERRKQATFVIAVTGTAMLVVAIIFSSPGPEPFGHSLRVQLICSLLLAQLARPAIWVRTTLWLTVLAVIAVSSVDNAMGSNLARIVWFCLPVAVVATSKFNSFLALLIVTPLLAGGWNMTYIDLRNAIKPVSSTAYYTPLTAELDKLPDLTSRRLEVVDHGAHAAYDALLDHATLARGWETQEDIALNSQLLTRRLNPITYKTWLDNNAVGYVALPAATVAHYGEYDLVDLSTPDYLSLIWSNDDWRLYRVAASKPIVAPPAQIVRTSQSEMVIDVPCACTINVRVHFSKYLNAIAPAGGSAQVTDDGSGCRLDEHHHQHARHLSPSRLPQLTPAAVE